MDTIQLFSTALGLGFLAGIRLYATVFLLGLAVRLGWIATGPGQEQWQALAHPLVLTVAGAACAIEFLADKIAWLDSVWDALHLLIRPVGAALLAGGLAGDAAPAIHAVLWLLAGGTALSSHSSKAAARYAVNHSPEPFSNTLLSLAEDGFVLFGLWLLIQHPWILLGIVLLFLGLFIWMAPRVYRWMRRMLAGALERLRGRASAAAG